MQLFITTHVAFKKRRKEEHLSTNNYSTNIQ